MRRPIAAGLGIAFALVVLPLTASAAGPPEVTLRTPSADDVVVGEMAIDWTYRGFSPRAWVDIEASRGDEPFERIARVRIDDGTPGYRGSTTWATTPEDDGADYTIRLVVPSNKQVRSTAWPVVVDNTAPEATEVDRTAANDAGWNNGDVTVRWACTDAASGPVEPEVVATVAGEGTDLSASATCTDRAGHSTTATAGGVNIDRTAPAGTVVKTSPREEVPSTTALAGVSGSASDALSLPSAVHVTFVDAAGISTQRQAVCDCRWSLVSWTVPTTGLAPGRYLVTATITDGAGNTGATETVEFLIVAPPEPPTVTPPEPPTVTPPEVTPPPSTPPEVTAPEPTQPPVTVPPVTVPAV